MLWCTHSSLVGDAGCSSRWSSAYPSETCYPKPSTSSIHNNSRLNPRQQLKPAQIGVHSGPPIHTLVQPMTPRSHDLLSTDDQLTKGFITGHIMLCPQWLYMVTWVTIRCLCEASNGIPAQPIHLTNHLYGHSSLYATLFTESVAMYCTLYPIR